MYTLCPPPQECFHCHWHTMVTEFYSSNRSNIEVLCYCYLSTSLLYMDPPTEFLLRAVNQTMTDRPDLHSFGAFITNSYRITDKAQFIETNYIIVCVDPRPKV